VEDCLKLALCGTARQVDAGICNGKYFINGVGIGFDGEIVKSIHKEKAFLHGHLAYYAAVLRKVFSYVESEIEVKTNDLAWKLQTFMLTVANGSRYGGGFLVAPNAKVDDSLLDVVLIPRITILQRLKLLPGAGEGKHMHITLHTTAQSVAVRAERKLSAHFDGEEMESENFEINILPGKFLLRY
jgi:YegS/Rv2252/BmrU family lipid kinase